MGETEPENRPRRKIGVKQNQRIDPGEIGDKQGCNILDDYAILLSVSPQKMKNG